MGRLRWTIQLVVLVLVNIGFVQILKTGIVCPVFYCYGCPSAAFGCPIGGLQSFTAVGIFPFYIIGSLGVFGVLAGRLWCGWACPFGTVQDVIMRLRRRADVARLPTVPWPKYVVLGGTIIAAWVAADTLFCKVCPAGSLFASIPHRFVSPEFNYGTFFWVHVGTLVAAVVAFVLIGRFWCRYLCPLGSIFGAFNRVSILGVRIDAARCNQCRKCLDVCPVNIENPEEIGRSTDCIQCGKCVEHCSRDALKITASVRR